MFGRIRWRLTAWYMGVLLAIIAVMGAVTYVMLSRALSSEIDGSLRASAASIAVQFDNEALEHAVLDGQPPTAPAGDHEEDEEGEEEDELRFVTGAAGDAFYLILAPDGSPILNPLNVRLGGVPDAGAAREAASDGEAWRTLQGEDGDYRVYSLAVRDGDAPLAVIQVGRSLQEHERQLHSVLAALGLAGGGGLLLVAVGGLFIAGRALVPVRSAFQRQRAFVADASHELRTPLALIRADAEILERDAQNLSEDDREAVDDILKETGHMTRLVESLLTLAQLDEAGQLTEHELVDFAALVADAVRQARRLAGGRDLDVAGGADGPLPVRGDPLRLRQLLLALTDNAVRYTPDGGRVRITGRRADGRVEVKVADTGPGIPREHLPHLFDRFYRVEKSRSRQWGGAGLGLSIAWSIAQAHGGWLMVASREGEGTTFTLSLPAGR